MLAVDTNVIVRYLTKDDARQAARAAKAIDGSEVFIPATVILEVEWVLRSLYRQSRGDISAGVRTLLGQPTVTTETPAALAAALDWFDSGMDLADALHLAASRHCSAMISFDADLAKTAKKLGAAEVRRP